MVKKAIIPAAGYGTRSLPITKVIPKEMFPIGVKPAIQYVIEEAIDSGIEEILIIVSRTKNLIVDYFDQSLELETFLIKENKSHLMDEISIPNIQLHYTRQPYAKGLGDAIRLGKTFAKDEPFAVLLPDDIVLSKQEPGLKQLIDIYENTNSSAIGLNQVESQFLKNYGVIKGEGVREGLMKITDLIEKPKEHPPSNLAVIGRYVFTPQIFSYLERIKPGAGGEYQLTDAIKGLLSDENIFGKEIEGKRYDIGKEAEYVELVNLIYKMNNKKK